MLAAPDYAVIGFYLCFMAAVGWFFRRFDEDSSEYFRGGGRMPWWMVGASNYISSFSVWTFTGAVGLAYERGLVVFVIFWSTAVAFVFTAGWAAARYRQTRVVTIMEIVRHRLGRGNEQVFTWVKLPLGVILAAIWLYSLAVFCAPAFGLGVRTTILLCGGVVLVMASLGGSWAVVAGGFVQSLVLLPVGLVIAVSAWLRVGGWSGLVAHLPTGYADPLARSAPGFGAWWLTAMLLDKFFQVNGVVDSGKYFYVRDGAEARRTAILMLVLTAVGPALWFIPAFVARAQGIDLRALFPQLAQPAEGAYVAVAHEFLPAGLMGLMITAILSTTLSSMDVGLNSNAGILVRSVYVRLFRPAASEREQVLAGRLSTLGFGAIVIVTALLYSTWTDVSLFSLMLNFQAMLATPVAVPLFWSIWVRRSPDWAAWASVLLGFSLGIAVGCVAHFGDPSHPWVAWTGVHSYAVTTLVDVLACSALFLGSRLLPQRLSAPRQTEVKEFFATVRRPVSPAEAGPLDAAGIRTTGRLCLLYAGFMALLVALPNGAAGRSKIFFCAIVVGTVGALLLRFAVRHRSTAAGGAVMPSPHGSISPP